MKILIKLAALTAAILFLSSDARADRLFVGDDWGTNLYEFDTVAGSWSRAVFCSSLHQINGLNSDSKGNLFEADYGTHAVNKFTPDGAYSAVASFETGPGASAFDDQGNLFVPFPWAASICKVSPDGVSSVLDTNLGGPAQVVFDKHGTLFAGDQKSGHIYTYDPEGVRTTFASGLKWMIGLVFDSHGLLFVADSGADLIYKFAPDGKRIVFTHKLKSPSGLAFDHAGNLFASDGAGKVYQFRNKGGILSNTPILFASDLGHNYFITILPGSMPFPKLLSSAVAGAWMYLVIFALLSVGVACFFWLRKKKQRSVSLNG